MSQAGQTADERKPKRLAPSAVTHLAFEGGGGKGGAYLGALTALSHEDVAILTPESVDGTLRYTLDRIQIDGITGTSAGAITATMLASNYSLGQLTHLTMNPNLLDFFDVPGEEQFYRPAVKPGNIAPLSHDRTRHLLLGAKAVPRKVHRLSEPELIRQAKRRIIAPLSEYIEDETFQPLIEKYGLEYIENVLSDYGVFSGCAARTYLARWVVRNAGEQWPSLVSGGRDMTFADHATDFGDGVTLRVVGVDVTEGEPAAFGHDQTPRFKVADAVRISMGIPFVFKPVEIRASQYPQRVGVWIDGGVRTNYPLHAFDRGRTLRPDMLGFRLMEPARERSTTLKSYGGAVFGTILEGATSGEIRTDLDRAQTIDVPTGELKTLTFLPRPDQLQSAAFESAAAVFRYFREATGEPVGVDPDDSFELTAFLAGRLSALWSKAGQRVPDQ